MQPSSVVWRPVHLPWLAPFGPKQLAWFALCSAALCHGGAARADQVERFELSLAPDRRADRLRVELRMLFAVDPDERSLRGKKFVGQGAVFNLRAWGLHGDPLRAVARGGGDTRRRIEFDLSSPEPARPTGEQCGVTLQFEQETLARHRWRGQQIELEWPGEFQVPVRSTVYRIGPGLHVEGLACTPEPAGWQRCLLDAPRELSLVRSASPARWAWVSAGGLFAALSLAVALRRRRRQLLAGLPPEEPAREPSLPPQPALSYRVNAPATPEPPPPPRPLPPDLVQRWWLESAATLALAVLPPLVLAAEVSLWGVRHSPTALLSATLALSALAALLRRPDGVPRGWPTALLVAALSLWVAV